MKTLIKWLLPLSLGLASAQTVYATQCQLSILNVSPYTMLLSYGGTSMAVGSIELPGAYNGTPSSKSLVLPNVDCAQLPNHHFHVQATPSFGSGDKRFTAHCDFHGVPQNPNETTLTLVIGQVIGGQGESCIVMVD